MSLASEIIMGIDDEKQWTGIYEVISSDGIKGLMEVHEWQDWFEDSELDGYDPDGAWYFEVVFEDGVIDGGVCGYEYGESFESLEEFSGLIIIRLLADRSCEEYDELLERIRCT